MFDSRNNPIVVGCKSQRSEPVDEADDDDTEPEIKRKQSADLVMMNTLIKESTSYQNEFEKYRNFSDELLRAQNDEIAHLKEQIRERDEKMGSFLKEYEEKLRQLEPPLKKIERNQEQNKMVEKKAVIKHLKIISNPKLKQNRDNRVVAPKR